MRTTFLNALPTRPARLLGALAAGLACTLLGVAVARADLPADADALVYTGVLEDNGVLVEGTRSIRVELYDVATGGTPACFAEEQNAELHAGRFRLALPASCAVAARAQAETFVELKVAGATVGRTRVGAVPYALAAGHAEVAASANVAASVPPGAIGAVELAGGVLDHDHETQVIVAPVGSVAASTFPSFPTACSTCPAETKPVSVNCSTSNSAVTTLVSSVVAPPGWGGNNGCCVWSVVAGGGTINLGAESICVGVEPVELP